MDSKPPPPAPPFKPKDFDKKRKIDEFILQKEPRRMINVGYVKVEQGKALIKTGLFGTKVSFDGMFVTPFLDLVEVMDISVKTIEIDRRGQNGLICKDNMRADITVSFYIRIDKTEQKVLEVAKMVGCERASDQRTLEQLFSAKFSEALKTAGKRLDFEELYDNREFFKDEIVKIIGRDLNGYVLEDAAIDYLEQTPLEALDRDNILDAEGIRKITELTSYKHVKTNEYQREEEKEIKRKDVETREKILQLEQQEAEAEAKQQREIASVQAREEAAAKKVIEEERLKFETARIATEEEMQVMEENKLRQIEVAAKAKERTIAVEGERVQRDKELEAVERERMVEIKEIDKTKAVEVEKKNVQEVIRDRVIVEKTVAEEQEKIKDTVDFATAERQRKVEVIAAEKEAQENLIRETMAAEAREKAAKSLAEERITLAEAERMAAEKEADAKKTMAEATIVESSASGLADVKVKEAQAHAEIEHHKAEAFGVESTGTAKAKAETAKFDAEAHGLRTTGEAKAEAETAKYDAEAVGINKKAEAMKKFDEVGREHEEFKLELNKAERIELAEIDVQRQIAEAQAEILGKAMTEANIDIVGGDGKFLETFFRSISLAKAGDGFAEKSKLLQAFGGGEGLQGIAKQIKGLISDEGINTEDIKNLTISALLGRLALQGSSPEVRNTATELQGTVNQLGMGDLMALWLAK